MDVSESQPVLQLDVDGLDRKLGFLGLMWASETSIIGSGWLFGALAAALLAGPAAILGWILAAIIITVLALIHAELGGLFPVSGGTSRFPHYAFGSFAGVTFGWASYLQAASVAPIEVLAAVQYLSTAHWARNFFQYNKSAGAAAGTLHGFGYLVALGLLVLFVVFNLVGIRWLERISNVITTWKVIIPVLTILILIFGHFHSGNFGAAAGGFFLKHNAVKGIIETLPAGIIFSLLGFEQAVQLAGEAADPKRHLAKAVIASVLIGSVVYILIQVAFIGAMSPHLLKQVGGWAGLSSPAALKLPEVGLLGSGPFFAIAGMAGIGWLATVLRIDAVVSPAGTGLIYTTAASRLSLGMSRNGFLPTAFERLEQRTKIPVFSVIIAVLVGILFLLPFPSWASLVSIVTSASVLMYAGAPLSAAALRRSKPNLPRPYAVPWMGFLAPAAFVGSSWIIIFAGWKVYTTLLVAMALGYLLVWISYKTNANPKAPSMDWQAAPWIIGYFTGLLVISYFGAFGPGGIIGGVGFFKNVLSQGGNDDLTLSGTLIAAAIWGLISFYWAMSKRLPESKVDEYVSQVYGMPGSLGH
ncbi:MAG: APC family permease [Solirubrobacteraceae bacterium]